MPGELLLDVMDEGSYRGRRDVLLPVRERPDPVRPLRRRARRRPPRRPGRDRPHAACWRGPRASTRRAIDEVVWGNANGAGEDNRNVARMAVLLAGLPVSVPGTTVNRLCGSSWTRRCIASRADRDRRRRRGGRRRRGVDDPRAVGAAQAVARVPGRRRDARSPPRWAGGWSTGGCRRSGRSRWARPTSSWPSEFGDLPRAPGRVRRPLAPARRRGLGRRASTTTWSSRSPAPTWPATRASAPAPRRRSWPALKPCSGPDGTITAGNASPAQRRRLGRAARLRGAPPRGSASTRWPGSPAAARTRSSRSSSATPRSRPPTGPRPGRHRLGRRRRRRAQRGVRRAVAGLRRRLGHRPGDRQRQRRRDRHGPPARRLRRPHPRHPGQRLRESGERWGVAAICIGVGQGLAVVLENVARRRRS